MKILHLLASNKFSGAENVVCQIIKMFDGEIEMVYCSPKGEIENILKSKRIEFLPLEKLSIKEIKRVVKEYKPDIVHAHDLKATILASRLKGVKVVSHMHVNHPKMRNLSIRSILSIFALKRVSHIYWVSKSAYEEYYFKNKIKDKSEILPNIISVENLYRNLNNIENKQAFDVVYCGRITEQKDPFKIVEIAKIVHESLPNVTFGVLGNGDMLEETKKYADEMGGANFISFLGFVDEPFAIIGKSKIMILTSKFEGTPMVALESLALGTPIVSTKTDGMVDLLNDKIGTLYDTNEEAGNIIVDLLQNASKLEKMSQEAIAFSKNYNNIEKYKEKLKKEYR